MKNISKPEFEAVLNNELNKNFTDDSNIESPTYESFNEPTLPSNDDFHLMKNLFFLIIHF